MGKKKLTITKLICLSVCQFFDEYPLVEPKIVVHKWALYSFHSSQINFLAVLAGKYAVHFYSLVDGKKTAEKTKTPNTQKLATSSYGKREARKLLRVFAVAAANGSQYFRYTSIRIFIPTPDGKVNNRIMVALDGKKYRIYGRRTASSLARRIYLAGYNCLDFG